MSIFRRFKQFILHHVGARFSFFSTSNKSRLAGDDSWNVERITYDEFGNKIVVRNKKEHYDLVRKNGLAKELGWTEQLPDDLKYSPDELRERQKDA